MAAVAAEEERRIQLRRGGAAAPKLLILDINGLLLDTYFQSEKRPQRVHNAKLARFYVYKRPHCDRFVKFCLENFLVGVWSSAKEHNVSNLVEYVFGEAKKDLVFCWSQSHCTNSGMFCLENRFKPLFFKELSKVWECSRPDVPWDKGQYGPWNTLLIDDSPHKILRNPDHTAILPLAFSAASAEEDDFLLSLESYLERLLHVDNVQKFVKLNPFGQPQLSAQSPNWQFYLKAKLNGAGKITKEVEVKLQSEPSITKEGGGAGLQSIRIDEQDSTIPELRHVAVSTDAEPLHVSEEKQKAKSRLGDGRKWKQSTADTEMVHAGISDEEQEMRKSKRSRNREQRRRWPEHVDGIEEHTSPRQEQRESRRSAELKHDVLCNEMSRQRTEVAEPEQVHQKARRSRSRPWVSLPRFERQRVLWYRGWDGNREACGRRERCRRDKRESEYDYGSGGARNHKQDRYESYSSRSVRNGNQDRYESEYDYSSRGAIKQDKYETEYDRSSRGARTCKRDRSESHYSSRGTTKQEKYEPEYDYNSRGNRTGSRNRTKPM